MNPKTKKILTRFLERKAEEIIWLFRWTLIAIGAISLTTPLFWFNYFFVVPYIIPSFSAIERGAISTVLMMWEGLIGLMLYKWLRSNWDKAERDIKYEEESEYYKQSKKGEKP